MPTKQTTQQVIIFGLLPEFLGKPVLWYAEQEEALRTRPLENPLLREKTLRIEVGARASLPELLRRLDELGYEKVFSIGRYGEFSHRGGILDVFPLNSEQPIRIEFIGNRIEEIETLDTLSDLKRKEWEKIIRRSITAPLEDIREGDFLVHLDHGIGRFAGKQDLAFEGEMHAYFVLDYARGDRLFVPEELAPRKLSRYIGFTEPAIHRLGGTAWLLTKRKVREEAQKFAQELLALYAERAIVRRSPWRTHDALLDEFIASFPYEETADQHRAWREIVSDLSAEEPMDRLLAGDVAFGKTEVALRATVLLVANGAQAGILAPTTILADQHYRTSQKRFTALGITSAILTRLQSPQEQRRTIAALSRGEIDIVIGTHRLLSSDIAFKNLGLIVIDEEQRFGVKQKEALKRLRLNVDVLSLSATPIPRTLAQALSTIRPVSRLQVPPPGRTEIVMHFGRWNKKEVREALLKEKRRGGQAYVLHNRVATIASFVQELRQLVPEVRFGIAHGRLDEPALIRVMNELREGKIDALVATTIIENGLDIANVNTLLIEDASKLGLAQAYQIRGRIGRSAEQGFAYFFWRSRKLAGKAEQRLNALEEATTLGSGWRLALRDLEIRGAGNLLGREQSGLVNRIGFNLYTQILAEAVEKLRTEPSHVT